MKSYKEKKSNDGLVSKVMKLNSEFISSDNHGRYIPFCDFGYHRGIIVDESVCKFRHCNHYYKLYIGAK